MAIEIKELIIRAVVDGQSEKQGMAGGQQAVEEKSSMLPYLESIMRGLDNKNER